MSGPRFTVTLGKNKLKKLQSRAPDLTQTAASGMYSDQLDTAARRQPGDLRDRLERKRGLVTSTGSGLTGTQVAGKRRREDDKWQHDMYGAAETGSILPALGTVLWSMASVLILEPLSRPHLQESTWGEASDMKGLIPSASVLPRARLLCHRFLFKPHLQ